MPTSQVETLWTELWSQEQKLIDILYRMRTSNTVSEGNRKIISPVDSSTGALAIPQQPGARQMRTSIILPGSEPQRPHRSQYQGGSIQQKLRFVEEAIDNGTPLLGDTDDLFGDSSLFDGIAMDAPAPAATTTSESSQISVLRQEAGRLSLVIFDLCKQLGRTEWLCDTMSARDVNFKMGGDGTYLDKDTGGILPISSDPLGKHCVGRRGNLADGVWIFECVLCPVNYVDNDGRIEQWKNVVKSRTETARKTDDIKE